MWACQPGGTRVRTAKGRWVWPESAGVTLLVVANFLSRSVEPVYLYVTQVLGARLGTSAKLVSGSSVEQFETGEIDAGFL
ncbi:MAG: hypothetical protein Kow00129_01220 [Thermoleophilia bacterium]